MVVSSPTPLKINMGPNHGGLGQIIFVSKWLICKFHVNLPGRKYPEPGCTLYAQLNGSYIPYIPSYM